MAKKKILLFTKLIFSVVLISLLICQMGVDELVNSFSTVDAFFIGLSFIALFFQGFHSGYLWKRILNQMGSQIGFWRITKVSLVGGFFGFFVPSSLGVDLVRTLMLTKHVKSLITVASSTLVLRGVMLLALLTLGFVGGVITIVQGRGTSFMLPIAAAYFCFVLAFMLFFNFKFQKLIRYILDRFSFHSLFEKIYSLYSTILELKSDDRFIFKLLIYSSLNQVVNVLNIYFIARAVGIDDVGLAYYFIYVPVVLILTMLPISIAGIGVREGAFVAIFSFAGVASSLALAVSLILFLETVIYALIGGVVYLFSSFDIKNLDN